MALKIRESDEYKAYCDRYDAILAAVEAAESGEAIVELLIRFYEADASFYASHRLAQEAGSSGTSLKEAVLLHPLLPTQFLFSNAFIVHFELVIKNPMFYMHLEAADKYLHTFLMMSYTRYGLVTRNIVEWILSNTENPALIDFFSTLLQEAGAPAWAMVVPKPEPIKPKNRMLSKAQRERWLADLKRWLKKIRPEHEKKPGDDPYWTTYAFLIFSILTNYSIRPKDIKFVDDPKYRREKIIVLFFDLFFSNGQPLLLSISQYLTFVRKIYAMANLDMPRHPLIDVLEPG